MNAKNYLNPLRRLGSCLLALVLLVVTVIPAQAVEDKQDPYQEITATDKDARFTYELYLTDSTGMPVKNPRALSAGETLSIEIRLIREDYTEPSYASYGLEFRLLTRGLRYNNDGLTLRGGTKVRRDVYMEGDSVGFAWYDLTRAGESIANPILAASWSYTVEDPTQVNLTVPVALIYITGDDQVHVPTGPAWLFLEPQGGTLLGPDLTGEYTSGTELTLPAATFGDYVFQGWSDGVRLWPAGSRYTLSGIVTLTAQWAGLERNRHLAFQSEGGSLVGEDPTGFYADGEVVKLPDATREGYNFLGWSDGRTTFAPGTDYTVDNTVNFTAQWEKQPEDPGPLPPEPTPPEPTPPDPVTPPDDPGKPTGAGTALAASAAAGGLGAGFWWLLLLWKRRLVCYSLRTGDLTLYHMDKKKRTQVEVVLYEGTKEYRLNKSGLVEVHQRLRFIKNSTQISVAEIKPGKYKGKLIISDSTGTRTVNCRIKAVEGELKDPET